MFPSSAADSIAPPVFPAIGSYSLLEARRFLTVAVTPVGPKDEFVSAVATNLPFSISFSLSFVLRVDALGLCLGACAYA